MTGPPTLGAGVLAGGEITVADPAHPAGARQVTVDDLAGTLRLLARFDTENAPGHLILADTVIVSVEKTEVGIVKPIVVFRDAVRPRHLVRDFRHSIR